MFFNVHINFTAKTIKQLGYLFVTPKNALKDFLVIKDIQVIGDVDDMIHENIVAGEMDGNR